MLLAGLLGGHFKVGSLWHNEEGRSCEDLSRHESTEGRRMGLGREQREDKVEHNAPHAYRLSFGRTDLLQSSESSKRCCHTIARA